MSFVINKSSHNLYNKPFDKENASASGDKKKISLKTFNAK